MIQTKNILLLNGYVKGVRRRFMEEVPETSCHPTLAALSLAVSMVDEVE